MPWNCACGHGNEDEARFCSECGAPKAEVTGQPPPAEPEVEFGEDSPPVPADTLPHGGAPEPGRPPEVGAPPPPKKSKALIIVLVLVVVGLLGICLIGIIAAIAVPNFLAAKEKAKQSKAVLEVRAIGEAVEKYQIDNGSCPDTGHGESAYYSIVDVSQLRPFLVPKYLANLPEKDPWNTAYSYGVSPDASQFVVICNGSDGVSKLEKIPEEPVTTSCYEDEIIYENNDFIQRPEGKQKKCK
jgi:general secretion pathway protein G